MSVCVCAFIFNVPPTAVIMEMGATALSLIPQPGEARVKPVTHDLQGEWFIHYTTTAPAKVLPMCIILL